MAGRRRRRSHARDFQTAAKNGNGTVFVCAHGAGGHMRDRSLEALGFALRERGISVVRFNFLYREEGMEQVVQGLPPTWQMHWLEGADYSFQVRKSSGRTDADVLTEAADATARWASNLNSVS